MRALYKIWSGDKGTCVYYSIINFFVYSENIFSDHLGAKSILLRPEDKEVHLKRSLPSHPVEKTFIQIIMILSGKGYKRQILDVFPCMEKQGRSLTELLCHLAYCVERVRKSSREVMQDEN